jgi:hypothetical protein
MSSINGKFPAHKKVMPIFGGHGAQNQNHQKENGQNQNGQTGFSAADSFVPQKNAVIDSGSFVPNTSANFYKTAQWEKTAATPNINVKIIAELHGSAPDGTPVQINIIHNLSENQKSVYDSVSGVLNKGVVSASWQTKAKGTDWNKGNFTFLIIGGKASRESTNALKLA